jgi:hypothetical protein
MYRYRQWKQFVVPFTLLLPWLAGCGSSRPAPEQQTGLEEGASAFTAEFEQLIGEYMPPLEDGRLEIAPPKDWSFSRAGAEHLVGFHPVNATLNDLPRILISAAPSPFDGVDELSATNAQQVVQAIQATLASDQLKSPAAAVALGGRTWIEYVGLAKSRGSLVARQTLQTVVDGRLYQVRLEVLDRHFANQRQAGYAVAASARFGQASGSLPDSDPEAN